MLYDEVIIFENLLEHLTVLYGLIMFLVSREFAHARRIVPHGAVRGVTPLWSVRMR
jgi:hypothetical protein